MAIPEAENKAVKETMNGLQKDKGTYS